MKLFTCDKCGCSFNPEERDSDYFSFIQDNYDSIQFGELCVDCAVDERNRFDIFDALMQIKYCGMDPSDFPNVDLEGYALNECDELINV